MLVDREGHRITHQALAEDLPRFLADGGKYANVNILHSNVTIGRVLPHWTSPEGRTYKTEARRLGGLRRRREVTLAGAYEFNGLETVKDIRRLLDIAVLDTLGLENSVARSRTIAYPAQVALKALETVSWRTASRPSKLPPKPTGSRLRPPSSGRRSRGRIEREGREAATCQG